MTATRDQIIATTCDLLEEQGLHATGLNQIIKESGAPKGSLYYYFPEGKDAIAEAAIQRAGRTTAARIRAGLAVSADAAEAVRRFVLTIAGAIERSDFCSGGPLTTIAMETATTNARLNAACRGAYAELQGAFEEKLAASGFATARAQELATFVNAAIEGGIILCRTYHSGDPLRVVAANLADLLRRSQPSVADRD